MLKPIAVPVMWSFKQAKVETGLKVFTLTRLVKSGKVKYIRLGAGQRGKILINAQSLCDYMAGGVGIMTPSEKILASLRTGEDNAVSLSEECQISRLDNRSTRRLIEDMRQRGQVICSSPKGYFHPANELELRRYIQV